MPDYTYTRPTDPAADEAELVEALHAQAAPLDLEYTYDAPPVRLVRACELDTLRAELDALRRQRDALDADSRQAARVIADLRGQVDAMRADLDLVTGWLDSCTDGLSVQELAQLADVVAEVRQRWGLEPE